MIRGGPDNKLLAMSEYDQQRLAALRRVVSQIPDTASVAATEHEGPHVSTRLVMYSLKYTFGYYPDYVLYGTRPTIRLEPELIRRALVSGEYGLAAEEGGFRLLQRGAPRNRNEEALSHLEPPPE